MAKGKGVGCGGLVVWADTRHSGFARAHGRREEKERETSGDRRGSGCELQERTLV